MIPGTPDGAVVLSTGGLAATQVVRAGECRGWGGLKKLLHTLLVKIYKSLCWLQNSGSIGASVCTFAIACWIPRRLSRKAMSVLKGMLRKSGAGDIDGRFELILLVPPSEEWRRAIFTPKFESHLVLEDSVADKEGLRRLLQNLHSFRHIPGELNAIEDYDSDDLGFLGFLLGESCH